MESDPTNAWLALFLLGAFHGLNPGMGWLFAVALGLQEKTRVAVWRSLLPLALGHALAVGVAILLAALVGMVVPLPYLKWGVALILLAFGLFHLVRHRHPRFGGMQVGMRDLTVWSFLMASAHGAGLMVLPFLFGAGLISSVTQPFPSGVAASVAPIHSHVTGHTHHDEAVALSVDMHGTHAHHAVALLTGLPDKPIIGLLATLLHTIGYLVIIGVVAVVVYEKVGLRWLRRGWVNLDLIWAATLILTAALTVVM
jgi:hypothetical protein